MLLSEAQLPNAQPIVSPRHDIYFLEVSQQFRNDMAASGIPFYESVNPLNQQVWIAQYPGSIWQRSIATAMITDQRTIAGPLIHHQVSTQGGSSGSPLLQYIKAENTLRTIGMHRGAQDNQSNVAASIASIVDVMNHQILNGYNPPVPVHAPHQPETYAGITVYTMIDKMSYC